MSEFLNSEILILISTTLLSGLWGLIKVWWWVPLPVILFFLLKFHYLWYINDVWASNKNYILFEIKIPREVERPMKAMEQVVSNFWTFYDPPNFKEKWLEGKYQLRFTLEIVSIDGVVHFYIRIPEATKDVFESSIYSQYPDVEIMPAEDYTKKVPQNIPDGDWDFWGCDCEMVKDIYYPIKTYKSFFEPSEEIKEEKRVDPLAVLVEGMTKLHKGEQMWLQIKLEPVTNGENQWITKGKALVEKLAGRPAPSPRRSITGETIRTLVTGKPPFEEEEKKEASVIPVEMRLTPGEREIVQGVEDKISKRGFKAGIRYIYMGQKGAFFKPNLRLGLNFFNGVSTENLNAIKPWGKTITKISPPAFARKRRLFILKRRLFRLYCDRLPALFPGKPKNGEFLLNTEEVATLFHFPSRMGAPAPGMPRIESKKGGAPPLPSEEL